MRAFVLTVSIVFIIDLLGKAAVLYRENFSRSRGQVLVDMIFNMGLLLWGFWALAATG